MLMIIPVMWHRTVLYRKLHWFLQFCPSVAFFLPIMMKMVLANLMKMVLMAMFVESNLLPALLWVPAVSPRAVMLTTGLDTFMKNKGF